VYPNTTTNPPEVEIMKPKKFFFLLLLLTSILIVSTVTAVALVANVPSTVYQNETTLPIPTPTLSDEERCSLPMYSDVNPSYTPQWTPPPTLNISPQFAILVTAPPTPIPTPTLIRNVAAPVYVSETHLVTPEVPTITPSTPEEPVPLLAQSKVPTPPLNIPIKSSMCSLITCSHYVSGEAAYTRMIIT
jgi:hypothetical protein